MAASALWPLNFGLQNVTYGRVFRRPWGWIYFGYRWVVVDGGGYILAGGGWWWVVVETFWLVVGGGGWWHSLV